MPITSVGLSTADFAYSLGALPGCLERFRAWGLDSVELSLSAFDVVIAGRVSSERLRRLRAACAETPLAITVHGPISSTFTDAEHQELHLDVCRASLDVCGEIGAKVLVWHAGAAPHGDARAIAAAQARERAALAEIAPYAAARGVVLALENIFGDARRWQASPEELARQIAAVGHPNVRATIDFGHAAINAEVRGYDLMESLTALAPHAAHLHVHDSCGRPQTFAPYTPGDAVAYGLGDLHLPPGWGGVLDWRAIAALPFAPETRITANLEVMARHADEMPDAVALCRDMIQRSMGAAETRAV